MFTKQHVTTLGLALLMLLICNSANARHKGCSMKEGFFKDVCEFRKQHHEADLDITSVAEKYIHIGDSIDKAKSFLTESGFEVYKQSNAKTNEKYIFGIKIQHHKGIIGRIFSDKYVIYVFYEDNSVTRILAQKFYNGL